MPLNFDSNDLLVHANVSVHVADVGCDIFPKLTWAELGIQKLLDE
jgi:hypothetical protein